MRIAIALLICTSVAGTPIVHGSVAYHDRAETPIPSLPDTSRAFSFHNPTDEELHKETITCVRIARQIVWNIIRGVPEERYLDAYHSFIFGKPDLSDEDLLNILSFRATTRAAYQSQWTPEPTEKSMTEAGALACLAARSR